jgi:glycerophosphoryl diester phosphodiesterase
VTEDRRRGRLGIAQLRRALKPAIAFEIWFTLVFVIAFAPASGWLLNHLVTRSGQYAIADHDLLAFAFSPSGVLFLLLTVGLALAFWFAEQVGLLLIVVNAARETKTSVSLVLKDNLARLPALVRLGLLQGAAFLGLGIPAGIGIWLALRTLLSEWDFYFYLNVQPASWWVFVAVTGMLLATYGAIAVWLYVRWLFAIPALVFENALPMAALRRSWRRTRGRFLRLAGPLALSWFIVFLSSFLMTWLIRSLASRVLEGAGLTLALIVPTVLVTLALLALVELIWFIIGKTAHVILVADAYLDSAAGPRAGPLEEEAATPEVLKPAGADMSRPAASPRISPAGFRRLGWLIAAIAALMGIAAGVAFLEALNLDRSVAITAHRGSKYEAPENTLSAIRQAIADGADYAEIDVQTTADGVVVLLHDADLKRVASVPRRIYEIGFEELREVDVGSWFAPEFGDERIATLQEAIDLARGRIKLNIELKYTRDDPTLAPKVGEIVRENDFADDCVISSLKLTGLRDVEAGFPELKTGFIVFRAVGDLARVEVDFLSVSAANATSRLVRDLRRRGRGLHVWTVDDPQNALAMIELGVDNIITGRPVGVRRVLDQWNELSDGEKIALMLRNLIVRIERPEPGEL